MEEELLHLLPLLQSLPELCNEAGVPVNNILSRLRNGKCNTSKGLSFLEVKNHLLLDYLVNLTQVVLKKCSGVAIVNSPAVDRLVEIRTVLERIKPIEHKLKYQIDKLLKTASSGNLDRNDPLLLRPNPGNFITSSSSIGESSRSEPREHDEGESDSGNRDEDGKKTARKYVPPKLAAVHYDGGRGGGAGGGGDQRALERAKKRALSSSIMREIRQEYYDEPEEIADGAGGGAGGRRRTSAQRQERIQYEEDTMTRVTVSKRQRHAESQGSHHLHSLTNFSAGSAANISAALDANTFDDLGAASIGQRRKKKSQQKKTSKSKKYKGKKFKKRKSR